MSKLANDTQIEAFHRKVVINTKTMCWEWQGSLRRGYGDCRIFGQREQAHRAAFRVFGGHNIACETVVRHTCDNRRCCNPDHLLAGSHQNNMRDMVERGRSARGEKQHSAKLTADQVRQIRRLSGRQRDIAKLFGVSQPLIGLIRRRKIWTHLET